MSKKSVMLIFFLAGIFFIAMLLMFAGMSTAKNVIVGIVLFAGLIDLAYKGGLTK